MACTALAASPAAAAKTLGSSVRPRSALVAAARPQRVQRRRCAARAAAQPEDSTGPVGAVQDFARSAERVLSRYDFLSAGMGALVVTGFCVARGQDVGTALWITAAASVVAILVNDLLPEDL